MIRDIRELDYQIGEALFDMLVDRESGVMSTRSPGLSARPPVPAYSRDEAAAQHLIAAMHERGYAAVLKFKTVGPVTMYQATVYDRDGQEVGGSRWDENKATAISLGVVKPLALKWPAKSE